VLDETVIAFHYPFFLSDVPAGVVHADVGGTLPSSGAVEPSRGSTPPSRFSGRSPEAAAPHEVACRPEHTGERQRPSVRKSAPGENLVLLVQVPG
jgi:hypothetical protein